MSISLKTRGNLLVDLRPQCDLFLSPFLMRAYDSETWFDFCGFNCILRQLPERETW